ncbi:hypothetical protein [Streptomyces sp. NBC_01438]|uniref:hypothetical protein n=1 Tax=Streptomyces sp. NBC_01438 TaxID=2903866 RepID=UPI003243C6BE
MRDGEWIKFQDGGSRRFVEDARDTVRCDPAGPSAPHPGRQPARAAGRGGVALALLVPVPVMFPPGFPESLLSGRVSS